MIFRSLNRLLLNFSGLAVRKSRNRVLVTVNKYNSRTTSPSTGKLKVIHANRYKKKEDLAVSVLQEDSDDTFNSENLKKIGRYLQNCAPKYFTFKTSHVPPPLKDLFIKLN